MEGFGVKTEAAADGVNAFMEHDIFVNECCEIKQETKEDEISVKNELAAEQIVEASGDNYHSQSQLVVNEIQGNCLDTKILRTKCVPDKNLMIQNILRFLRTLKCNLRFDLIYY